VVQNHAQEHEHEQEQWDQEQQREQREQLARRELAEAHSAQSHAAADVAAAAEIGQLAASDAATALAQAASKLRISSAAAVRAEQAQAKGALKRHKPQVDAAAQQQEVLIALAIHKQASLLTAHLAAHAEAMRKGAEQLNRLVRQQQQLHL
jgi:hypothetical protein